VICVIVGEVWKSSSGYVFNITELPERCDIITVGQFALDRSGVETLVDVEDESNYINYLFIYLFIII